MRAQHVDLEENQYKCPCRGCQFTEGDPHIGNQRRSRKGQYFRRLRRLSSRKKHNGR